MKESFAILTVTENDDGSIKLKHTTDISPEILETFEGEDGRRYFRCNIWIEGLTPSAEEDIRKEKLAAADRVILERLFCDTELVKPYVATIHTHGHRSQQEFGSLYEAITECASALDENSFYTEVIKDSSGQVIAYGVSIFTLASFTDGISI